VPHCDRARKQPGQDHEQQADQPDRDRRRIESGKGELGIYLIGDDTIFPWRWKIRPADFNNLQIVPKILKGVKVADIVTILGSVDVIMGSVDR